MDWKAGDRAVCVIDQPGGGVYLDLAGSWPLRNAAVYTVVEVGVDSGHSFDGIHSGLIILRLAEVSNPIQIGNSINGFDARRFRPLVSRTEEQDIALFKRIASSPPAKGREVEREYSEGV